ncbi:putative secreted protein [Sorangium cellulosum So ce56]|uniref:Secreted protein n=1 Tax=Sorangium cellulosum (strain So ce56) TaxID=448385 RepID=A9G2U0_SORC5|nr:putative secreted protein [Sorangium cellulosum So ce56]
MAGSKRVNASLSMALIGLAAAGGCTALAGLDESYHLVGGGGGTGGSSTGGGTGGSAGGGSTGGEAGGSADGSSTGGEAGAGAGGEVGAAGGAGGSAECATCSLPPYDTDDPADMCEASAEIYEVLMDCLCVACGLVEELPCYGACGAGEARSAECNECLASVAANVEGECAPEVTACEFDTGE